MTGTPLDRLTPQQRDVLAFTIAGLSQEDIAGRMGMHPSSVKRHLRDAADLAGVPPCGHRVTRLAALAVGWAGQEGPNDITKGGDANSETNRRRRSHGGG